MSLIVLWLSPHFNFLLNSLFLLGFLGEDYSLFCKPITTPLLPPSLSHLDLASPVTPHHLALGPWALWSHTCLLTLWLAACDHQRGFFFFFLFVENQGFIGSFLKFEILFKDILVMKLCHHL